MEGTHADHPRAASALATVLAKDRTPPIPRRLALISVFGVHCGISTYAEMLWPELRRHFDDSHVFAEAPGPDMPDVTRCWRRGEPLTDLVRAIEEWGADVILIAHEFGHFPLARHWLAFMGALGRYRTVVTFHSTYEHHDKTIVEAAAQNIIVHTERQRDRLLAKGVTRPLHIIPHGCPELSPDRLWNLLGSEHSLIQWGFLARYKGFENSLHVVAALKPSYPDIFFTGLLSGTKPDDPYLHQLNRLAVDLGVADHVGLISGYFSDDALDAYLRTHKVAIFPYIDNGLHTVAGASGAARFTMSRGLPVVASSTPLFDGLPVPRPSTIDGWAHAVEDAFEAPDLDAQNQYLLQHSWANVAKQYAHVLTDN